MWRRFGVKFGGFRVGDEFRQLAYPTDWIPTCGRFASSEEDITSEYVRHGIELVSIFSFFFHRETGQDLLKIEKKFGYSEQEHSC